MRIGYNTWSMATVPFEQFVPGLADIGYRAIAISVVPGYRIAGRDVPNAAALDRLGPDERRRLTAMFEERELLLPSVIGNQNLLQDDEAANAEAEQRLPRDHRSGGGSDAARSDPADAQHRRRRTHRRPRATA